MLTRQHQTLRQRLTSKHHWLATVCIAFVLSGLLGCHRSTVTLSEALPQRGYLWQRAWNPAVIAALEQADARMDGMVIIGAEIVWNGATPETIRANIDWQTLKNLKKPVSLALRVASFPGPFSKDDATAKHIIAEAKSLLADAAAHGLRVSEFQLDFDCAQKKLSGYSVWVDALHKAVQPTRFVITTLPAWLNEPGFEPLVRLADGYVLQVHSVPTSKEAAHSVLLDASLARQWVRTAANLGIPFSVALPTYRCLAAYDKTGKLLGVAMDSVDLAWPPGSRSLEFSTDPDEAAALVKEWRSARPAELKDLIWYRIPVATDQRNWRWPTLAAIMAGRKPVHRLEVIQRGDNPVDLSIKNTGEADRQIGVKLTVTWTGASVVACDALPGWTVASEKERAVFTRVDGILSELPPGSERSVGWLRFDNVVVAKPVVEESPSG